MNRLENNDLFVGLGLMFALGFIFSILVLGV
jgi:hypothetical protein